MEQADTEALDRSNWGVRLFHGPMTGPARWAGTSILEITGDTADLTHLYDQLNTDAATLPDTDPIEVRRGAAVGVLARRMNGGRSPRVRLYLHADLADLTDDTIGTGSVERLGPLTLARIKDWVGHSAVTVIPVLRMDRTDTVDRHDPPAWMRETVILRDQHCIFPWCATDARSCDLDHITPYDQGGQTSPGEPRAAVSTSPPRENPTTMALPTRTRRHLHLDRTPRPALPRDPHGNHRAPLMSAVARPSAILVPRMGWPGDRVEATPRGRSGLYRARWWVTPTRGNPRDSATEMKPPPGLPGGKGETVV